jgi:hypothetical protein
MLTQEMPKFFKATFNWKDFTEPHQSSYTAMLRNI